MRSLALKIAWAYIGKWYIWGGDDPSGFDCSGFIVEILKSIGRLPRKGDWTAAGIASRFPKIGDPLPGDLVFWKNKSGKIIHVEMVLESGLSIGASGGGSQVRTVKDAIRHNAFIKIRPYRTRANLWGFVNPY